MDSTNDDLIKIGKFVYEAGILNKTPRSGLWFLGTGDQSVAEHLFRTACIGYALAHLTPGASKEHVVMLSIFHDFAEGRTSDLNYIHQRYGRLLETEAMHDISETVPFGKELESYYLEEQARETLEAKLTKDADTLEWMATLREEEEKGNTKAPGWVKNAQARLKTEAGQKLGQILLELHPDAWWFNAGDEWFIDRDPEKRKWGQPQENEPGDQNKPVDK